MEWMPNNVSCALCPLYEAKDCPKGLMIGNNTAIKSLFIQLAEEFSKVYRKRYYLHKFE